MFTYPLGIRSYAIGMFGVGVIIFLIGISLGKILRTTQKIEDRGLSRPMKLTFLEQLQLSMFYPDVYIPIALAFTGVLFAITSIFIFIVSVILGLE